VTILCSFLTAKEKYNIQMGIVKIPGDIRDWN
jgi:hypothetical protein